MRRRVIYWYHLYLNHPVGLIFVKKIQGVFYLKGLVTQVGLFAKTFKICKQFKKINTIYGHLTPKNVSELKPWY